MTDMGAFNALNSVEPGGIDPKPGQTTGGDGKITGEEVKFDVAFTTPFDLSAGHYFFVPQVEVKDADGNFFWLSASRPIAAAARGFPSDRPAGVDPRSILDPDWLRVGTDIVGGATPPRPSMRRSRYGLRGSRAFDLGHDAARLFGSGLCRLSPI